MPTERQNDSLGIPIQSPIYHAQRADQYARQDLIRQYEDEYSCCLLVMIASPIFRQSFTMFEELIYDADPDRDIHLLLHSPGGDGEIAIRIVRAAQSRCAKLTVIVPDMAKSAATLLSLGANNIMMGPASDLGPIDPQIFVNNQNWVAAKDIIAAVDDAAERVRASPETYPVYASLLNDITSLTLQQARSELGRASVQLEEALKSNPVRQCDEVARLKKNLERPIIEENPTHAALFSADDAIAAGLPVTKVDPSGEQWQLIWRLWAKYFALGELDQQFYSIYENARVSQIRSYREAN